MDENCFSNAALVLLGHGTTQNAHSGLPVLRQVAALRQRGVFGSVHGAFWKQEPRVTDVLNAITENEVYLVPLFLSEGYFSDQIIPEALGFGPRDEQGRRVQHRGKQVLCYCNPVGVHPRLTELLLERAQQVTQQAPFPVGPKPDETTLFIVGHGTERNTKSRNAVEQQVSRIQERGLYASVQALFLEEEPKVEQACSLASTRNVVVVPCFISDGLHTQEDIPVLLGEPAARVQERLKHGANGWRNPTEKKGKLIWYSGGIGSDPMMTEMILDCARMAFR